jgi:hypothetical protein
MVKTSCGWQGVGKKMREFRINNHKVRREEDSSIVSATLEYPDGEYDLYFKANVPSLSSTMEPLLAASLLPAMKLGTNLHLPGPVSPKILAGVNQIQEIFRVWDKNLTPVSIKTKDGTPHAFSAGRGVACFFSGGVDSFYTILKHREEITHLVLVRGFDIHLEDDDVWARVSGPLREAAKELGKPLIEVETNVQRFSAPFLHWTNYFGSAMASVSLLLSPWFEKIYIPAGSTFNDLHPWGSHPLIDPLWGTEDLTIVHDGCEATRVEKVKLISSSETVLKYLRVCFQNRKDEYKDIYNCGRCEKCIRTKISLYLVGVLYQCATFDHDIDLKAIAQMPILNYKIFTFAMENLEFAEKTGADQVLIQAIRNSLKDGVNGVNVTNTDLGDVISSINILNAENTMLKKQVQEIYGSDSWRITAPLRVIADILRNILRKSS